MRKKQNHPENYLKKYISEEQKAIIQKELEIIQKNKISVGMNHRFTDIYDFHDLEILQVCWERCSYVSALD